MSAWDRVEVERVMKGFRCFEVETKRLPSAS